MEIYKITNLINNKSYVGKTTNNFHKRYNHRRDWWNAPSVNKALRSAVGKYGPENFKVEILFFEKDLDRELLDQVERYLIAFYGCVSPNGYNFTEGGDGGSFSKEAVEKRIRFMTGRPATGKNAKGHKKDRDIVSRMSATKRRNFASGVTVAWNKNKKTGPMSPEAIKKSGDKHKKEIKRINPITLEEKFYPGAVDAEKDGFNSSSICLCCKYPDKYKTHRNFKWEYAGR